MFQMNIEQRIHKLYLDVATATGFDRSYGTTEYFIMMCKFATKLEEDLAAHYWKGNPKNQSSIDKIKELRDFVCR